MQPISGRIVHLTPWICLTMSILLSASANLLLKRSTLPVVQVQSPLIMLSLVSYGLAFLSYFVCLRQIPVSTAYPINAGGAMLVIVLAAEHLLGESITSHQAFGAVMVIIGLVLLLR